MFYQSTRGGEKLLSTQAVLSGLAKDGGLFMPSVFPAPLDAASFAGLSFEEAASRIFSRFLDDYPELPDVVRRSYLNKFDCPEIAPLKKVGGRYVLELFHGPTSAFKDVALSALPVLMTEAMKARGESDEILILTATSGDTGKAAMEGFKDVPGIRIIVFFPAGGVSPVQEKQMTSQPGANVLAAAIRGNFDDAQSAVKEIFSRAAREGLPADAHVMLSSANSINIGRLIPQIVYYFTAYAQLLEAGAVRPGDPVDFTVPTGNFGDILAGCFAKRLGLPIGKLICASNANNVLTDFLKTGVYDRNRPFYKTISPSMDILVSSNLERLLYLAGGEDPALVRKLMASLKESGRYEIPADMLASLQAEFDAACADDKAASAAIARVFRDHGYLMDPHTAVAWAAADTLPDSGRPQIILSTASPFKFPEAVLHALGEEGPPDPFDRMDYLAGLSGVPVPAGLAALKNAPVRFTDVVAREEIYDYVLKQIRRLS